MTHLDLFSGIGGFAYAIDQVWSDVEHIFCDNDKFCRAVLRKHWPESPIFGDVKGLTALQVFETIDAWHIREAQNMTELLGCTDEGCPFRKSRISTASPGKPCGRSSSDVAAHSDPKNTTVKTTASTGIPEPTTTPKICLNTPSERDLSNASTSARSAATAVPSKTAAPKSKPTTLTTTSPSMPCGCVRDAITSGTDTIKQCREKYEIDVLTAGVPCQPASAAGKRRGKTDDRWLWEETFEIIRVTQPTWCVLENVRGLLTLESGVVFEELCLSVERLGYEVQPLIIPAVALDAPHRRDRIWFVANAISKRDGRGNNGSPRGSRRTDNATRPDSHADDSFKPRLEGYAEQGREPEGWQGTLGPTAAPAWDADWTEVAAELCVLDDGLPAELGGLKLSKSQHRKEQLKAYGNAIVPQVAIEIMKAIKEK